jgi:hypothetical protein
MIKQMYKQRIEEWLSGYDPPSRKGVPRGRKLLISKKKMSAAFWMLLWKRNHIVPDGLSMQEVAQLADCNYGTLRVWRTQDNFKAICDAAHKIICEDQG